jgi:hypothetical protein
VLCADPELAADTSPTTITLPDALIMLANGVVEKHVPIRLFDELGAFEKASAAHSPIDGDQVS